MNKKHHSKNSIFLMELILNIFLFSVLLIIGLQFFIKTHVLTQTTTELHYATTLCSNIANIYESRNTLGDITDITSQFPYCTNMKNQIFIYFNDSFEECKMENSSYYVTVTPSEYSEHSQLSKADIIFYNKNKKLIYQIKACNYQPLTPSPKEIP